MQSKEERLKFAKLYLILDANVNSYHELFELVKLSIQYGVDVIQLRDKKAKSDEVIDFSRRIVDYVNGRIIFIVNDNVDAALESQADGVHLGQEDMPIKEARKILGHDKVIGISCQTYAHALKAEKSNADYIGFGSVFETLTKPNRQPMDQKLLEKVFKNIKIPVFAIGGINLMNASAICALGVNRMAVCRALAQSALFGQDVGTFKKILEKSSRG